MRGILDLVPTLRRAASSGGGEFAGSCPWCGGMDRFRVWPFHTSGRLRFWCRHCERSGDGVDLLRELKGLTFREAVAALGQTVADRRPALAPRGPQTRPLTPPSPVWQSRAEEVAVEAEGAMWGPQGSRALAYLRSRGFTEKTIRGARLGYITEDRREAPVAWGLPGDRPPVWLPRGVTLPWRACGVLWRLNVRRPAGDPRYIGPAGSANGLYGADGLRPGRPVVLVEGELDALAVAQEAGDLVAAVATGSTCGARRGKWTRCLRSAPVVLVAFDGDDPGEKAAGWWLDAVPDARRVVPEGDAAGMLEAGVDVRAWVEGGLA